MAPDDSEYEELEEAIEINTEMIWATMAENGFIHLYLNEEYTLAFPIVAARALHKALDSVLKENK